MLSGYRALDLTDEKGLLCGKMLGDLGVDVIKIEKPGGDPTRNIGPFYHDIPDPEKSLLWFAYNTSKRGITLDIETAEGREIFKKLATGADFIIESSRPGYMDSIGLGYSELSKINPRIIMTSITPFGQSGPYSDYDGSDIVAMAMGGLMYITGDIDRPPLRISADQAYCHAGVQAMAGTMIAHYHRELTGEGQHVDVSMQESIVVTLWVTLKLWNLNQIIQKREGPYRRRFSTQKRVFFPCKDGYIVWEILVGRFGRSTSALVDLMDEEGLAGEIKEIDWAAVDMNTVNQEQWDKWEQPFAKFFLTHTKAELHEEALKRDILLMPVNTIKDIAENKQLAERDYWVSIEHPELSASFTYPGAPFINSETAWKISRRAPLIGEHNREVYQDELGLSNEEIKILKQGNII